MNAHLVTCRVDHGIADVRLNRPNKLNALTLDTLDQLIATGRRLRRDPNVSAVIIAGVGDSFSAGLDFASVRRDPKGIAHAFAPRPWRGTNTFQEACWIWRRLTVPVIAAVHGYCLGGGVQIALGADFRITTPSAQWGVLETKWGLVPDMTGIRALAQQVGMDQAKKLVMTAEQITGEEAVRIGLATESANDPQSAARELAEAMGQRSPEAVAAAKRLLGRTWPGSNRRTFMWERLEQARLLRAGMARSKREEYIDQRAR